MFEFIEVFIIALASFVISFMAYMLIVMKYYKIKIKKIKDMAPNVTDMIIKSLDEIKEDQKEIYDRLRILEISVTGMKVKMVIYASMIGAITSGILSYSLKAIFM